MIDQFTARWKLGLHWKILTFFLSSPNPTSKMQRLDDGIIALVKGKFVRRLHFRRKHGRTEEVDLQHLFSHCYLLVAEDWHALSSGCIQKCFKHFENPMCTAGNFSNQSVPQEQVICDLNEHGVTYTRVDIESLVSPEEEDELAEAVTLDNQVAYTAGVESGNNDGTEDEHEDEAYSTGEGLKALFIATAILERQGR